MTSFDVGFSLFYGAVIALLFLLRWWYERKIALHGCPDPEAFSLYQGILAKYSPRFFPIFILAFVVGKAIFTGWDIAAGLLLDTTLQLLVLLTIYFGVLLVLLPLLRRRISALACATLWLLPTLLYFPFFPGVLSYTFYRPALLVLSVPRDVLLLLVKLWGAGAAAVLAWQIFSHYRFRRAILKDAVPVTDPEVLALWDHAQSILRRKKPIPLLISPAVASPLTVGLCSMAALLPQRDFTLEQYRLIFRHELLHIQRYDVDTKCFCMLCRAICWFNPLVWLATRRASDDLELSCDEMVVYDAEDDTRREYAALLLETAGDDRGFTTCLSASASSLRRRLKGVMVPRERSSGTLVLGLMMAALVLCSGLVGVSTVSGTAGELLFSNQEEVSFQSVWVSLDGSSVQVKEPSPALSQALLDRLAPLPVTRLSTGSILPGDDPPRLSSFLHDGEHIWMLELTDGLCSLSTLDDGKRVSVLYQVDGPVDWEGLYALVE